VIYLLLPLDDEIEALSRYPTTAYNVALMIPLNV